MKALADCCTEHFGVKNIGMLAVLYSKLAEIKNIGRLVTNCQICQALCHTIFHWWDTANIREGLTICQKEHNWLLAVSEQFLLRFLICQRNTIECDIL